MGGGTGSIEHSYELNLDNAREIVSSNKSEKDSSLVEHVWRAGGFSPSKRKTIRKNLELVLKGFSLRHTPFTRSSYRGRKIKARIYESKQSMINSNGKYGLSLKISGRDNNLLKLLAYHITEVVSDNEEYFFEIPEEYAP